MSTDAGRRQFDIAIAAMFRITEWNIDGEIVSDPDEDPLTAVSDSISGDVAVTAEPDERDFVSQGNFNEPPATPSPLNPNTLEIPLPIVSVPGVQRFEIPPPGLGPVIVINTQSGFVPFRFVALGPTNFKTVDSVKLDPLIVEVGEITIRVPAWRGTGYHTLTTPLFSNETYIHADFTITGTKSLPYEDRFAVPVWNSGNAQAILDPVAAHVDMRLD